MKHYLSSYHLLIKASLLFLLFTRSIGCYAQENDWKEYFIEHGNIYDAEKGKEYAEKKRDLLTKSLSFYDKQIGMVECWISAGKCKVPKMEGKNINDETILFMKMFYLGDFEDNLPEEVSARLNNSTKCALAKYKLKADKSFVPLFISLRDRLSKEKEQISHIVNAEDSVVLKYPATSYKNIGLRYADRRYPSCDYSSLRYNWADGLDENYLNSIPTKYGEIQIKNPEYNSAAGQWAWLYTSDYENVHTTYPIAEIYKKYNSHPEYKVKTINNRNVVYLNDEVVFIEKGKDKQHELIRQVCIYDYHNNKYDIQKSPSSLLLKIEEMLIEGKDRDYYVGCRLAYDLARRAFNQMMQIKRDKSLGGTIINTMINMPEPSDEEIKEFEQKLAVLEAEKERLNQFDKDPEYKIAENYINQLKSDRKHMEFMPLRTDGLSYLYTSSDGQFKIVMTMYVDGKSIKETFTLDK